MEKIFANGLIAKRPEGKSAEFVKLKLSVKVTDFINFLNNYQDNDWVKLDLKESQNEKKSLYFELNTWKPNTTEKYKSSNKVEDEVSAQKEMYGTYKVDEDGWERDENGKINLDQIPF